MKISQGSESATGKFYCSETLEAGQDGAPVIRYLHADGSWGRHCEYFNSEKEIKAILAIGKKPDFTMDWRELDGRQMIREDMEAGFSDWEEAIE